MCVEGGRGVNRYFGYGMCILDTERATDRVSEVLIQAGGGAVLYTASVRPYTTPRCATRESAAEKASKVTQTLVQSAGYSANA